MNKNQIYSLWPIYIGEFYNPEHQEIKDDLINFFSEYEKKIGVKNIIIQDLKIFL